MTFILQPWQLFFLILAGWINRYQQQVIDFYVSQTQALLESQGKKRILLSDDQRRRLTVKGKILGRKGSRRPGPQTKDSTRPQVLARIQCVQLREI